MQAGFLVETVEHALQRSGQRVLLQLGRREGCDDPAHVGETVTGKCLDLAERAHGREVLRAVGFCVGEQPDRGQPLGDGVVDVPGDPGPFGDRT